MIPASVRFDQSTMASMLDVDPLVKDYRAFFSLLDWSVVDRWQAQRSNFYGSHGHPLTTYIKAFLIRIKQGLIYAKQLRDYLVKHPLLVIELGFQLELTNFAVEFSSFRLDVLGGTDLSRPNDLVVIDEKH